VTRKGTFVPRKSADRCSKVQGIKEKLGENRNQDGLGWCFADVVADILSFETGQRLSDFDIGLRAFSGYGPEFSIADLNAGSPRKVLDHVLREGACSEENMPSNERLIAEFAKKVEAGEYAPTPKQLAAMNANMLAEAIRVLEQVRGLSLRQLTANENHFCQAFDSAHLLFPALSEFEVLGGITNSMSNEELFRWLVKRTCDRRPLKLPGNFRYKQLFPSGATPKAAAGFPLLPGVDKALAAGKPVEFGFRPNRFFNFRTSDRHVALIVGREFRNGTCQYLVRNSFGPSCGYYRGKYGSPANCGRGNFWITEEDFVKTADNIGFVE
jgi:hypothetical protein